MRIVVIGQAAFGATVVERIAGQGEEIVAVYTSPSRPEPVRETAGARGIPVFQPADYRDDHVFAAYRDLRPDLTVLAFVSRLMPEPYLVLPERGTICYHPSLLPRHRGPSAMNWTLLMGDTRTGVTVFWPDRGIDTGPILIQKGGVATGITDTVGSLYYDHLCPLGVEALLEAVAREIYDRIRGCDPQPGAFAFVRGEKVRFYGAELAGELSSEVPGTIVGIDRRAVSLAAGGQTLRVARVRPEAEKKVDAAAFAEKRGIRVGERFSGHALPGPAAS